MWDCEEQELSVVMLVCKAVLNNREENRMTMSQQTLLTKTNWRLTGIWVQFAKLCHENFQQKLQSWLFQMI